MAYPPEDGDDPGKPNYWQLRFSEASVPFEAEAAQQPSLVTYQALYAAVLHSYNYTCALTGVQFAPPPRLLHERLQATAIRPLVAGGQMHVGNFLCLDERAASAFQAGHLTIGPQFQILADLSSIDAELLGRLNLLGRLHPPVPRHAQPDLEALAYHRDHIFLGL